MHTSLGTLFESVRIKAPLVHNICNYVAAERIANTLLAIGASPLMADNPKEMVEISQKVDSLAVNIGTLTQGQLDAISVAVKEIKRLNKPWVLDPVGVGASVFRQDICAYLLSQNPTLVRGNASEIRALVDSKVTGRGVDAVGETSLAHEAARIIARNFKTVVAVTGAKDFVTDGTRDAEISNGHPLMTTVTGTGCALSAVLAAFIVQADVYEAVISGLATYSVAGEIAAATSSGPGTFQEKFLDILYSIQSDKINLTAKVAYSS